MFFLADSTRKEGITEFQVAAAASHFKDQGSLTVGCLRFSFSCLLAGSLGQRGGGGGGGVDILLNVDVSVNIHFVLGPGKDDFWSMLAA